MDDGLPVLPFPGPCTNGAVTSETEDSYQAPTSGGLSGGAATGLAIVMLAIGGLAGAVIMMWWHQRQQKRGIYSGYLGSAHSESEGIRAFQGVEIKSASNV
jgi:hypothetical protein